MRKLSSNDHAKALKRQLGLPWALKLAQSRMVETHPNEWVNIPKTETYYEKRRDGSFDNKNLTHLHNWWTHVYYVLKKEGTRK